MKTVKQIADEIGVDKQKVYRYIVRHGIHEMEFDSESGARNKTKYYDDQTVSEIKDAFGKSGSAQPQEENAQADTGTAKEADSAEQADGTETAETEDDFEDGSDFVNFLMQQLEEKDRQIFNLQKLLDQEQRLHLQTQSALDQASKRLEAKNTDKGSAAAATADTQDSSEMIREVDPYEMKPVTPAPASEEEPATVQTVSEVLAQSAARREEEKADSSEEPIFHDAESEETDEPPVKKKGFWSRLFGL